MPARWSASIAPRRRSPLPDPAVALRTQAALLRPGPGGVVAPIEFDLGSARSLPATPLAHQMLAWLADIVGTMLPLIEHTGVATAQQVGIETLQARLAQELAASQAVAAHPMLLSAWGTVG